ncbi:MAG TPA: translation elongation factor Ts [Bacillota bacterium]|nr:translation elongation factor Ts [Bacillota bacterium]
MAITAAMVKELREATGAGMMDCKKALTETGGDLEKAVDYLRENGLAKAAKKAGRLASEGLVRLAFSQDATQAAAIEVNSETDFVAKNEEFVSFVETLSRMVLTESAESLEAFLALPYGTEGSVQEALHNKIAKIGENMSIRRFAKFGTPGVKYAGYLHGGGKIGVIIGLRTEASADEISVAGKDVAMQAASMRPQFVDESGVDPDYLEHEKQILVAQALKEGKPAEIVEKMVVGRLKKELKETCLVEQKFVKNNDMSVREYVSAVAKDLGKEIKVVEMLRYEVGEGMEKKEENFAEEVAKQMGR